MMVLTFLMMWISKSSPWSESCIVELNRLKYLTPTSDGTLLLKGPAQESLRALWALPLSQKEDAPLTDIYEEAGATSQILEWVGHQERQVQLLGDRTVAELDSSELDKLYEFSDPLGLPLGLDPYNLSIQIPWPKDLDKLYLKGGVLYGVGLKPGYKVDSKSLRNLRKRFPQIEHLSFFSSRSSLVQIDLNPNFLKGIVSLSISGQLHFPATLGTLVLQPLPEIQELRLEHCSVASNEELQTFIQALAPNVRRIYLSHVELGPGQYADSSWSLAPFSHLTHYSDAFMQAGGNFSIEALPRGLVFFQSDFDRAAGAKPPLVPSVRVLKERVGAREAEGLRTLRFSPTSQSWLSLSFEQPQIEMELSYDTDISSVQRLSDGPPESLRFLRLTYPEWQRQDNQAPLTARRTFEALAYSSLFSKVVALGVSFDEEIRDPGVRLAPHILEVLADPKAFPALKFLRVKADLLGANPMDSFQLRQLALRRNLRLF